MHSPWLQGLPAHPCEEHRDTGHISFAQITWAEVGGGGRKLLFHKENSDAVTRQNQQMSTTATTVERNNSPLSTWLRTPVPRDGISTPPFTSCVTVAGHFTSQPESQCPICTKGVMAHIASFNHHESTLQRVQAGSGRWRCSLVWHELCRLWPVIQPVPGQLSAESSRM